MTLSLILVRDAAHVELGKTLSGRRRDIALSRDGLRQAEIVADLLAVEPIAAVYSSPRERAWYTARELADRLGYKVLSVAGLDEVDFGEWTGLSYDALEGDPGWNEWNSARSIARPPGGESMEEAVDRALAAVAAIRSEHRGQTVAAVSHCDIIRGLIAFYLGLPIDNLLRFDIDPASVSRLVIGEWGARVASVNERLYR